MTHADALDFLLLLGREVERVAQKDIPVPLIAGVAIHNRLESFGESNFLHKQKTRVSKRAAEGNRQSCKGQAPSATNEIHSTKGKEKKILSPLNRKTFRTHPTNGRDGLLSRPSG